MRRKSVAFVFSADMIAATRSYEANVTTMQATKNMALKTLEIGR